MKPVIEWLISVCAGLLFSTQSMRILKIANDESSTSASSSAGPAAQTKSAAAIEDKLEKSYIMGSEQISAELKTALSSDGDSQDDQALTVGGNKSNNGCLEYTLGSESLNRMLEDMLTQPCSENLELPYIEPAIQL